MKHVYSLALVFLASMTQYVSADDLKKIKKPTKLSKPVPKTHAKEPVAHTQAPPLPKTHAEPVPGTLIKREPEPAEPKKPLTLKEHITETIKSHSKTGSGPSSADADNLHKLARSVKDKDLEVSHTKQAHDAATTPAEKKEIKKGLDSVKKHRQTYWEMFEQEVKNVADKVGADSKAVWDDIKKHF